jgi:hypothetical protein
VVSFSRLDAQVESGMTAGMTHASSGVPQRWESAKPLTFDPSRAYTAQEAALRSASTRRRTKRAFARNSYLSKDGEQR